MAEHTGSTYRLGDLLALSRQNWVRRMARELADRGFPEYRATDAAAVRLLLGGPVPVGRLGALSSVTRQAARKAARSLEQRGYAVAEPDPVDARRVLIELTDRGVDYARAVTEVIELLNRSVMRQVSTEDLAAADRVLRATLDDPDITRASARIPPP